MKLIILGGGAIQVKNIRLSKGMTASRFVNSVENGADILTKLKERSNRINWANLTGKIEWTDNRGTIQWFLTA